MTTHLGSSAPARVETISVTEAIGGRAALTAPAPNAQVCAAEASSSSIRHAARPSSTVEAAAASRSEVVTS